MDEVKDFLFQLVIYALIIYVISHIIYYVLFN
jgi:hypothetical protein